MKRDTVHLKPRLLVIVFMMAISLLMIYLIICRSPHQPDEIKFDQVASYHSKNGDCVYTFYVSETNWNKIKQHAGGLKYPESSSMAVYYFPMDVKVKDITSSGSFQQACKTALNRDCIAFVYKSVHPGNPQTLVKYPGKGMDD